MSLSLKTLAREYVWLWDVRHGRSADDIAIAEGRTVDQVRRGVERAKGVADRDGADPAYRPAHRPRPTLSLLPLFPIGPLTPTSPCPHTGAVPPAPFVCMVCGRSHADEYLGYLRVVDGEPMPLFQGA